MAGTSEGGKKSAAKLLAKDPQHFSKLAKRNTGALRGKDNPGSFKPGNKTSVLGGKAGKRGPKRIIVQDDTEFEAGRLEEDRTEPVK